MKKKSACEIQITEKNPKLTLLPQKCPILTWISHAYSLKGYFCLLLYSLTNNIPATLSSLQLQLGSLAIAAEWWCPGGELWL